MDKEGGGGGEMLHGSRGGGQRREKEGLKKDKFGNSKFI